MRGMVAGFRPRDMEALARGIAAATEVGRALFPRGGGMSYTDAYLPDRGDSIVIDMGAMNRVLSINETDLTARVEAGCTWANGVWCSRGRRRFFPPLRA